MVLRGKVFFHFRPAGIAEKRENGFIPLYMAVWRLDFLRVG